MALEPKTELTCMDICKMFEVSRTTVFNWRKKGMASYTLPGNGLHDPVRWSREVVLEFTQSIGRTPINEVY